MYAILMRLADRGQLETTWETGTSTGRPPRHLYRLTPSGLALVADLAITASAAARRIGLPHGPGREPCLERKEWRDEQELIRRCWGGDGQK
jgi:DNA-binding PadR family transcriptional regulator